MTPLTPQLSVANWLSLPVEVRHKLVTIFEIPRSEGAHVEIGGIGGRATSDGHTYKDLGVITVEKMQSYFKSEEADFFNLFNEIVGTLTGQVTESSEVIAQRLAEEKINRWGNILAAMKSEAKELDLEESLNNLLTLAHGEITPKDSPARKRTGRPAKS